MKKIIQKINKESLIFGSVCLVIGVLLSYFLMLQKVNHQKDLTKRILSNSLQSMQASKQIADTCTQAYNTATACVSNLNTCNIEAETKKLDEFNYRRGQAEEIIDWMGNDMKAIIEEVKMSQ